MNDHILLALHITDRVRHATRVQEVLTTHGCAIKTRLGLHEAGTGTCAPDGLVILEMCGEPAGIDACEKDLRAIEGLAVQRVTFGH